MFQGKKKILPCKASDDVIDLTDSLSDAESIPGDNLPSPIYGQISPVYRNGKWLVPLQGEEPSTSSGSSKGLFKPFHSSTQIPQSKYIYQLPFL